MCAIYKSLLFLLLLLPAGVVLGEFCDRGTGECKELTPTDCPVIFYNQHLIGVNRVKYCDEFNDIVCCPLPLNAQRQQQQQQIGEPTRLFEKGKQNCCCAFAALNVITGFISVHRMSSLQ